VGNESNPVDLTLLSDGEDVGPVASASGTGGETVKTEKDEEGGGQD
jgi:hypothetical protein